MRNDISKRLQNDETAHTRTHESLIPVQEPLLLQEGYIKTLKEWLKAWR